MKKSDIYEIATKILGLYLLIVLIGYLRAAFSFLSYYELAQYAPTQTNEYNPMPEFILGIIQFIVITIIAYLFIIRTKYICKIICQPDDFVEPINFSMNKSDIYKIALVIIGFATIISVLPPFAIKLQHYIHLIQLNEPTSIFTVDELLSKGIKLALGIIVISFRNTISTLLVKETTGN
jgi:hypothetical protein